LEGRNALTVGESRLELLLDADQVDTDALGAESLLELSISRLRD
jgi:hypothetical protein